VVLGLVGMLIISCGDDDDGSSGGGDGDSDSDSDGDADSETEPEECGGELEPCCDGSCDDDLDPVENPMDGSCACQAACTFATCAAGDEEGYCSDVFGMLEDFACYNELDFPPDLTPHDCTDGDSCTTNSGDSDGMCVAVPNPMTGDTINRCVVSCDTLPEGCDDGTACAPAFDVGDEGVTLDHADAHCAPPM
jgi:hypothetical protein